MPDRLNNRNVSLEDKLEHLRGVYRKCSDIFKDIPTEHTQRALDRLYDDITEIENQIKRQS